MAQLICTVSVVNIMFLHLVFYWTVESTVYSIWLYLLLMHWVHFIVLVFTVYTFLWGIGVVEPTQKGVTPLPPLSSPIPPWLVLENAEKMEAKCASAGWRQEGHLPFRNWHHNTLLGKRGNLSKGGNPCLPGKWPLKWCVCTVYASFTKNGDSARFNSQFPGQCG